MEKATIKSENLEVSFQLPGREPVNTRFDAAAVMEKVVLNGKHSFCVPEQLRADRITSRGTGLCCEFVWNALAEEVPAGEWFPKLGVGLLRQRPEGGPYHINKAYEADPYETTWEIGEDRAVFIQQPKPCLGVAVRVLREVRVAGNRLSLHTTLHNVGTRPVDLYEYQHNFVAINGLPVGPGYRLELPWYKGIEDAENQVFPTGDRKTIVPGVVHASGQAVEWDKPQPEGTAFHPVLMEDRIAVLPRYGWRLSHAASPASIAETTSYAPRRAVIWCIEHCLSTEMYAPVIAQPGQATAWSREWVFEGD